MEIWSPLWTLGWVSPFTQDVLYLDLDTASDGTGFYVDIEADVEEPVVGTVSVTPENLAFKKIPLLFSDLSDDGILKVEWPVGVNTYIDLFSPSSTFLDGGSSDVPDLSVAVGSLVSGSVQVNISIAV